MCVSGYSLSRKLWRRAAQTLSLVQRRRAGGSTRQGRSSPGPNLVPGAAWELDRATAPSAGHDSDALS